MPKVRIGTRGQTSRQPVVDVPPMVGTDIFRRDAQGFDPVDEDERRFDLRPAREAQENVSAGGHMRYGGAAFIGAGRAQNIESAFDRAIVVRGPSDEGENRTRFEADGASAAAVNRLLRDAAEANPALDPAFDPHEINGRPAGHGRFLPA